MKILGLTGGVGSGKSTVSGILKSLGAKVIDADAVAHQVIAVGQKAYREVIAEFGSEIIDDDGNIDRKKLGEIVFNDKDKLKTLNDITHKYIIEKMIEDIAILKKDSAYTAIVLDVPIPVKHGFIDMADSIWVVAADEDVRIGRLVERDGCSRERVRSIIRAQMSQKDYIKIADVVIENNGDIESLKSKVIDEWEHFLK